MRIRDKKENNSKSLDHIGVNQYAVILHFHRHKHLFVWLSNKHSLDSLWVGQSKIYKWPSEKQHNTLKTHDNKFTWKPGIK